VFVSFSSIVYYCYGNTASLMVAVQRNEGWFDSLPHYLKLIFRTDERALSSKFGTSLIANDITSCGVRNERIIDCCCYGL
jgi:hypothetical protein